MKKNKTKRADRKSAATRKLKNTKNRAAAEKPEIASEPIIDVPQESVEIYLRPNSFTALAFPLQPEVPNDDHTALTDSENCLLTECEDRIEKGVKLSAEMAAAFFTIKTRRLYREGYRTFEDYCHRRWNFSRQHGYRIAKTGEVQGLASQFGYMVTSEHEGRRLGRLSAEELKEVLELAAAKSNGQPITKGLLAEMQVQVERDRKPAVKQNKVNGTTSPMGGVVPDLSTLVSLDQILVWLDEILLEQSVDQKSKDKLEMIKCALALHVSTSESNTKAA